MYCRTCTTENRWNDKSKEQFPSQHPSSPLRPPALERRRLREIQSFNFRHRDYLPRLGLGSRIHDYLLERTAPASSLALTNDRLHGMHQGGITIFGGPGDQLSEGWTRSVVLGTEMVSSSQQSSNQRTSETQPPENNSKHHAR